LWFAQIEELSRDFRVIALDTRAIGRSDTADEEYSIALLASDTAGLLRSLGIEKAHIAGLSMGGFIAQEMAIAYPSLVHQLVLIATGLGGAEALASAKPFWDAVQTAIRGKSAQDIYRIDLTLMTAPDFPRKHPEIFERAVALRMKNVQPLYAFLRQQAACLRFDNNARAHNIFQPTLIVLGKEDPLFPIAWADSFHAALPHAKMIVYEDCGHAVHLEKPGRLSKDIREFLKTDRQTI
jgi:pimeloyl-ACP methyl ester carboxylesterase